MLQRKQTIYLLLSVIIFVLTYYFPFGTLGPNTLNSYSTNAADGSTIENISTYGFAIPLSIAETMTLFSIFMYNNRQRQMLMVRLTFLLYAFSFALLALYILGAQKAIPEFPFKLGVAFFLPFASFIMNVMALRLIRKDDKLVKSVDRIR